jgi:hypothetical protein
VVQGTGGGGGVRGKLLHVCLVNEVGLKSLSAFGRRCMIWKLLALTGFGDMKPSEPGVGYPYPEGGEIYVKRMLVLALSQLMWSGALHSYLVELP